MTPFRDSGTETLPAEHVAAAREVAYCNWVQSMDGDVDTAHISSLHQFDVIDDVLAGGEDWRVLGTNDDPVVRQAMPAQPAQSPGRTSPVW